MGERSQLLSTGFELQTNNQDTANVYQEMAELLGITPKLVMDFAMTMMVYTQGIGGNYWGLIFGIVILIPNIMFAITCKDGFENRYQNKLVEFLEQIGRFGCFFSMFLIIPFMNSGYWFKQGETVYLVLFS